MASRSLPPAQPQASPAATTIRDLSTDLLLEIFIHLPSLPSLVRAALACPAFLAAVRSSPAFRRRFRALHSPPLLGLFSDPSGPDSPSFEPIRRRSDPDLAAAVRGADFFLTRIPGSDDARPGWQIRNCRAGYVLFTNWYTQQIVVYNPVTGKLDHLPAPPDEVADGCDGEFAAHSYKIVASDEAPSSFRVIFVCHDDSRVRAAVISSATREWRLLPWEEPAPAQPMEDQYWLLGGTQANGCLYFSHADQAYMVVLDTATLQFSCIDLPVQFMGQGHIYRAGETRDGKLCIISAAGFELSVWYRRADADGVDRWILDSRHPLEEDVLRATEGTRDEHGGLKVYNIIDGVVYMHTMETLRDFVTPCWFLTFCLKTRKLEKLFHKVYDNYVHPYIMAWPPSLIGCNVRTCDSGSF